MPKLIKEDYSDEFRVLYVERLVYWKGLHLAIKAFAEHIKLHPKSELTVIGSGPDKGFFQKPAIELGVNDSIKWIDWMQSDELLQRYQEYGVFLFPSYMIKVEM